MYVRNQLKFAHVFWVDITVKRKMFKMREMWYQRKDVVTL